jgi:hypothetical protein
VGIREHHGCTELRKAGLKRLSDAEVLAAAGRPHRRAAQYLAGYAIECKLKAVAMEVFNCFTLADLARRMRLEERDVYTHGLEALAGRLPSFVRLRNSSLWRDFAFVNRWRPAWRYDARDATEEDTSAFLGAVRRVYHWLESNR